MKNIRWPSAASLAAVLQALVVVLWPSPAHLQEEEEMELDLMAEMSLEDILDPVTVTATKDAQRVQDAPAVIVVPGVSVIHFGEKVTAQRDYFDVGAMLYERLPLIGWLLRWVKRMVA